MKPRNSYQQRIVELSSKLPGLTTPQYEWGQQHCFQDAIFRSGRNKGWCTHCGSVIRVSDGQSAKCPVCGKTLKVTDSKKRVYQNKGYLTVLVRVKEFQVCRHFHIEKSVRRGETPQYDVFECVQNWINARGKETILALRTLPYMMYFDVWDENSEMTIKRRESNVCYSGSKYDISGWIYPKMSLLPELKRNGFDRRHLDECPVVNQFISLLLSDREAEMLVKQGQYALLRYKWKKDIKEFGLPWKSIKVATRHGYTITDASMWIDHIELLRYFGRDIHNPHFICPDDLGTDHAKLVARKQKHDEQEKIRKDIESATKWEEQYRREKAPFLGICFGNENIVIAVVQSVAEMAEEGARMHHCVFANGYYKRTDSLILSARDKNGNRIETIELSLKTFEVIQSRGVNNLNTSFHDEILSLVRANINQFKQAV